MSAETSILHLPCEQSKAHAFNTELWLLLVHVASFKIVCMQNSTKTFTHFCQHCFNFSQTLQQCTFFSCSRSIISVKMVQPLEFESFSHWKHNKLQLSQKTFLCSCNINLQAKESLIFNLWVSSCLNNVKKKGKKNQHQKSNSYYLTRQRHCNDIYLPVPILSLPCHFQQFFDDSNSSVLSAILVSRCCPDPTCIAILSLLPVGLSITDGIVKKQIWEESGRTSHCQSMLSHQMGAQW